MSSDTYREAASSPSLKVLGTFAEVGCVTLRGIATPEVLYEVACYSNYSLTSPVFFNTTR